MIYPSTNLFLVGFAAIILIIHLVRLLRAGSASAKPFGQGTVACCGDARENNIRQFTVFGGAAAFDFGLLYFLIANFSQGWFAEITIAYAWMRFGASIIQTALFYWQALQVKSKDSIVLKAHLDGCGYTTAASPLWPLYWLGKISFLKRPIIAIRDLITRIDYLFSFPGIMLLNAITLFSGRRVRPLIGPVGSIQ
jgi:hypothetical protein